MAASMPCTVTLLQALKNSSLGRATGSCWKVCHQSPCWASPSTRPGPTMRMSSAYSAVISEAYMSRGLSLEGAEVHSVAAVQVHHVGGDHRIGGLVRQAHEDRALGQLQRHVALEQDRPGQVGARREHQPPVLRQQQYGPLYGGGVHAHPVALRAEVLHADGAALFPGRDIDRLFFRAHAKRHPIGSALLEAEQRKDVLPSPPATSRRPAAPARARGHGRETGCPAQSTPRSSPHRWHETRATTLPLRRAWHPPGRFAPYA